MDSWLEDFVEDTVFKALRDFFNETGAWAAHEIEDALAGLEVGKPLSSSPLVVAVAVDPTSVTLLVRGRKPLFGGSIAPFLRLQIKVSKSVPADLDPPIRILEWQTVVGDLQFDEGHVVKGELGFGWNQGTWLGRGALKLIPAGFGVDILLGGLNERGLMIGLDVDFPAPIPLGPTGLALSGIGGDFAYNFIARLERNGLPIADPNAHDYVDWARNHELDRWAPGPPDKTTVGVGIRADLRDALSNGWVLWLEPIGLAVLTPGPVFILGGAGRLIKTDSLKAEGYVVVDIGSESIAMGLGITAELPRGSSSGPWKLVKASGTLDALFSFREPSIWYVNFGTNSNPVKGKFLASLDAELFLMLNSERVLLGVGVSIGGEWKLWIIKIIARAGLRAAALVGWDPKQFEGAVKAWGELGLEIWEFSFKIILEAEVIGSTPQPTQLDLAYKGKLDLPWPIPDVDFGGTWTLGDSDPKPPALKSPLLFGEANLS